MHFSTCQNIRCILLQILSKTKRIIFSLLNLYSFSGVSAYCGSLWLASLCVSAAMADEIGDVESKGVFAANLQRARRIYIEKLWNGSYFKFCEESRSRFLSTSSFSFSFSYCSDSIMADQLCGIWFLQSVSPKMAAEVSVLYL